MLARWDLLERDLHDAGVDVGDDQLMTGRSWRWLSARIVGLTDRPPVAYAPNGRPVFGTRIQEHVFGPAADAAAKRAAKGRRS